MTWFFAIFHKKPKALKADASIETIVATYRAQHTEDSSDTPVEPETVLEQDTESKT